MKDERNLDPRAPENSVASIGGRGPVLPPVPSLDEKHLRVESIHTASLGVLEALVPAAAPYLCPDRQAPALLLVPGLGLDGLGFIRQLPLGALAHLQLFQTPNGPISGEEGLGCFARYVEEYILASKLDQHPGGLVLGGASLGGAISLLAAIRGRVTLRGLVLLGTFGSSQHLPTVERTLAPLAYVVPFGFLRGLSWLVKGRLGLYSTSMEEARWMARPPIRRTHGYFGRAICGLARFEQLEGAERLRLPMLVVHGELDPVLPLAAGSELARTVRGARLVTIAGARHSLFFTHAEAVNAGLAEFIATLSPLEPASRSCYNGPVQADHGGQGESVPHG